MSPERRAVRVWENDATSRRVRDGTAMKRSTQLCDGRHGWRAEQQRRQPEAGSNNARYRNTEKPGTATAEKEQIDEKRNEYETQDWRGRRTLFPSCRRKAGVSSDCS